MECHNNTAFIKHTDDEEPPQIETPNYDFFSFSMLVFLFYFQADVASDDDCMYMCRRLPDL